MANVRVEEKPMKVICEFDEIEYFYFLHLLNSDIGETRRCLKEVESDPKNAHLAEGVEEGLREIMSFYESVNIFNLPVEDN